MGTQYQTQFQNSVRQYKKRKQHGLAMILTLVSLTCALTVPALAKPLVKTPTVVCPPSEDGLPVFIPHPTNCGLYYECQGDWPILLSCPGDLYFDPVLNVCNYQWAVDCTSKTSTAPAQSTTVPVEPTDAPAKSTTGSVEPTETP